LFFKNQEKSLPNFYDLFRLVALFCPSNACSERLNAVFTELNFDETCCYSFVAALVLRGTRPYFR
jgi:hypothetical protein